MKSFVTDLVDLVFPNCCPGCGAPFITGEEFLCSNCEIDMPLFPPTDQILDRFAGRVILNEARSYLKFYNAGIAQKLLHEIKYKGDTGLGEYLGKMFIRHITTEKAFADIDVVIPIPLHKSKLLSRGYNQSYFLAKGMAEELKVKVDDETVVRYKKSETQTRKSRAERWQNVSGIFQITNDSLRDKNVLLVDDVITTGATLEACGEAILDSGAASLSIAALAAAM
jgi:ComF family protein